MKFSFKPLIQKACFLLLGMMLLTTNLAMAADSNITVHPGQGIAGINLGTPDKQAVEALKKQLNMPLSQSGKDTEYEGQVVYYYYFGNKAKDNSYPVQVYSDVAHKVFIFEINAIHFVTPEGIKIGSSEKDLLKAYGNKLKKGRQSRIYTKYSLGGKKGTDFYVRDGVIKQILIRSY